MNNKRLNLICKRLKSLQIGWWYEKCGGLHYLKACKIFKKMKKKMVSLNS